MKWFHWLIGLIPVVTTTLLGQGVLPPKAAVYVGVVGSVTTAIGLKVTPPAKKPE